MDPFTQRMVERAKLRREKLDSQIMELEKGLSSKEDNSVKIKRKPLNNFSDNGGANENKKEKEYITSTRKNKLQKLAKLYSGNDENVFLDEDDDEEYEKEEIVCENTEKKQQCKLGRLNELATKIKQWEDDLKPSKQISSTVENSKEKEIKKGTKKNENETSWDPTLVEKLRSQGFALSENESRLIYDFENKKEVQKNSPKNVNANQTKVVHKTSTSVAEKLDKQTVNQAKPDGQNKVLKKAALFENPPVKKEEIKRNKDPAELSVAERKALFEKNKGEIVVPKNCFVSSGSDQKQHDRKPLANNSTKPKICHVERKEYKSSEKPEVNLNSVPAEPLMRFGNEEMEPKNLISKKMSTFSKDKTEIVKEPEVNLNSVPTKPLIRFGDEIMKPKNVISKNRSTFSKDEIEINNERSSNEKTEKDIPKPPPLPDFNISKSDISPAKDGKNEFLDEKSGRLYPSLSNLDISNEADLTCSEINSTNESKDNLCLNMTLSDLLEMNKNNPTTPPSEKSFSKSKECRVLDKMDKLLEDALNDLSSGNEEYEDDMVPSPPKMMKSSSFVYKGNGNDKNSLLHTVSFYRKQQKISCSTPHAVEQEEENSVEETEDESFLVQNKIQMLLTEVNKQQTIISQASQALNLCLSTVEFSGSGEQVEGERLLLLATHKRQACLNEIQRLKVENSLRPQGDTYVLTDRGDLNISNISLKLKRDALRAIAAAENLLYFVCLIKSDEQVLATPVVSASRDNLKDLVLQFPGQFKLEGLLSNFKITVEVYNIELNKEILPHEIKYHIGSKKEKKLLTPIKSKKSESKLVKMHVQSPAGPNAVRTSNFQMCGYIVFSLREVTRTQWTLNKVPYISPLEGTISMTIQSQLRLDDEFRGFLTMFDDISGFGAWHRRWCLLSSHFISYWKYPDDEQKKVPNGTIDLRSVISENVGAVSRDVCARLNTFLLETTRPRLSEDKNSLVVSVQDNVTTIRHLLSADSKQEMMMWCKKINTTLALLRSWKCTFNE